MALRIQRAMVLKACSWVDDEVFRMDCTTSGSGVLLTLLMLMRGPHHQ